MSSVSNQRAGGLLNGLSKTVVMGNRCMIELLVAAVEIFVVPGS